MWKESEIKQNYEFILESGGEWVQQRLLMRFVYADEKRINEFSVENTLGRIQ